MSFTAEYKDKNGECTYSELGTSINLSGVTQKYCLEKIASINNIGNPTTTCSEIGITNANNLAGNIITLSKSFLGFELTIVVAICSMRILKHLRPLMF